MLRTSFVGVFVDRREEEREWLPCGWFSVLNGVDCLEPCCGPEDMEEEDAVCEDRNSDLDLAIDGG